MVLSKEDKGPRTISLECYQERKEGIAEEKEQGFQDATEIDGFESNPKRISQGLHSFFRIQMKIW